MIIDSIKNIRACHELGIHTVYVNEGPWLPEATEGNDRRDPAVEVRVNLIADIRAQIGELWSGRFATSSSASPSNVHPVEKKIGLVGPFVAHILEQIAGSHPNIPVHRLELDHVCYRCRDGQEYLKVCSEVAKHAELVIESEFGRCTHTCSYSLCLSQANES